MKKEIKIIVLGETSSDKSTIARFIQDSLRCTGFNDVTSSEDTHRENIETLSKNFAALLSNPEFKIQIEAININRENKTGVFAAHHGILPKDSSVSEDDILQSSEVNKVLDAVEPIMVADREKVEKFPELDETKKAELIKCFDDAVNELYDEWKQKPENKDIEVSSCSISDPIQLKMIAMSLNQEEK